MFTLSLLCYFLRCKFRDSLSFPHFFPALCTRGHKRMVSTIWRMDPIWWKSHFGSFPLEGPPRSTHTGTGPAGSWCSQSHPCPPSWKVTSCRSHSERPSPDFLRVCLSLYVYVSKCVCVSVCVSQNICVSLAVCMCLSKYVYVSMCVCVSVHVSVSVYVSLCDSHSVSVRVSPSVWCFSVCVYL